MDVDPAELWQSGKGLFITYPVAAIAAGINLVAPRDWARAVGLIAGAFLLITGAWTAHTNHGDQEAWTSEREITHNHRPPRPDFDEGERQGLIQAGFGLAVLGLCWFRKPRG